MHVKVKMKCYVLPLEPGFGIRPLQLDRQSYGVKKLCWLKLCKKCSGTKQTRENTILNDT